MPGPAAGSFGLYHFWRIPPSLRTKRNALFTSIYVAVFWVVPSGDARRATSSLLLLNCNVITGVQCCREKFEHKKENSKTKVKKVNELQE